MASVAETAENTRQQSYATHDTNEHLLKFKSLVDTREDSTCRRKRKRCRPSQHEDGNVSIFHDDIDDFPRNILGLYHAYRHVHLKEWQQIAVVDLHPYGCPIHVITGNNHAELVRPVGKTRAKGSNKLTSTPVMSAPRETCENKSRFGLLRYTSSESNPKPASSRELSLTTPLMLNEGHVGASHHRIQRAFTPASLEAFTAALVQSKFDTLCVLPPLLAPTPAFLQSLFSALYALHNDVRLLINADSIPVPGDSEQIARKTGVHGHIMKHIRHIRSKIIHIPPLISQVFAQPTPFLHSQDMKQSRHVSANENDIFSVLLGITTVTIHYTAIQRRFQKKKKRPLMCLYSTL